MGRKKLYATEEERKATRANYDAKYYRRHRKVILKKQKKRYIERKASDNTPSSTKTLGVAQPMTNGSPSAPGSPRKISRAARQVALIEIYLTEWRNIVGTSDKEYCEALYTSALGMESDTAFHFLSDTHTALEEVLSKIQSALNTILEAAGTKCKEYKAGEKKLGPIKQCVSAVFDLWEAAAEAEDDYPTPLQTTFARGGFTFQRWGAE